MAWWNSERRVRGLVLLGVFGITSGLAVASAVPDTANTLHNATPPQPASSATPAEQPLDHTHQAEQVTPGSSSTLRVNGESVPLPSNGSIKKTIPSEDGSTSIEYKAESHRSSNGSSNSSQSDVRINIQSSQHSQSSVRRTFTTE